MNKVEHKLEKRNKIKKDIGSAKKLLWRYALNFAIILMAIFILGLMSALIFEFDFDYLIEPPFIITSIILSIIYLTVHWSSYNAKLKSLRANEDNIDQLRTNNEEIKEVVNTITWQERKHEFISERNQKEKIDAWKVYVTNELIKLDKKTKQKHKDLEERVITETERTYLSEEELRKLELKLEKQKRKSKYISKKKELKKLLEDEWIIANIDRINIDYNKVDVQFIETGDAYQGITKDKAETKGKYLKDNGVQRIIMLVLTLFITSFTSSLLFEGINGKAIFDLLTRLLVLFVNIGTGIDYGEIYYAEVDLHNSNSRVRIANEFLVWNKNNPRKEVS